jgi:S-adenosylmethionine-diacylgycerolhomoserine-N-methlytransferase
MICSHYNTVVVTAQKRVNSHGWDDLVKVIQGDACDPDCQGLPMSGTADLVTFSYALTMIPDWRAAIRNAYRMLKPVRLYN